MITFSHRAQGASHLKTEPPIPCQDYAGNYENEKPEYGIAAIADGHGSAKHFRCEIGSRLAVEVALDAAKEYMKRKDGIQKIQKMSLNKSLSKEQKEKEVDGILRHLKNYIVYEWRERVKKHFEENVLSEKEIEICEKEKLDMSKEEWNIALYGTTLLFAILIPSNMQPGILAFQIGDGGCVLIDENGEPRFLKELFDEVQEGGRTNSICASNAAENFLHIWESGKFKGITVASDGVTDSFDRSNDSYLKFTKTLFQNFENSPTDEVKNKLGEYLPELSKQGSADDMSIAGIFKLEVKTEIKE